MFERVLNTPLISLLKVLLSISRLGSIMMQEALCSKFSQSYLPTICVIAGNIFVYKYFHVYNKFLISDLTKNTLVTQELRESCFKLAKLYLERCFFTRLYLYRLFSFFHLFNFFTFLISLVQRSEFSKFNKFGVLHSEAAPHKYSANMYRRTLTPKCDSDKFASLLKSHFGMGILL